MQKYEISVLGCDDSTSIQIELSASEYELIKKVAEKITDASTYSCMPTMVIEANTTNK